MSKSEPESFECVYKLQYELVLKELSKELSEYKKSETFSQSLQDVEAKIENQTQLQYLRNYVYDPRSPKLSFQARNKRAELEANKLGVSVWVWYASQKK